MFCNWIIAPNKFMMYFVVLFYHNASSFIERVRILDSKSWVQEYQKVLRFPSLDTGRVCVTMIGMICEKADTQLQRRIKNWKSFLG